MNSIHPYQPFIPKDAKKLIIGTIPPSRFCKEPQQLLEEDVNFYYGSRDNYFWQIIGEIFNKEFLYNNSQNAVDQRKEFLTQISAGITDTINECIHLDNSASDNKLKIIRYNLDLVRLLEENPQITTLIYTSDFVKKLTYPIFKAYHTIDKSNKRNQSIKLGIRNYDVNILHSPSPQALRNMGKNGSKKRVDQYREVFSNY